MREALHQTNTICLGPCPHDPAKCYEENRVGEIKWGAERSVIHVCADGSQWEYTAREGILAVQCPFLDQLVPAHAFQATATCHNLLWYGNVKLNFIGKSYVTWTDKDRRYTMNVPVFGLFGVYKSYEEFQQLVEKELEKRHPLREFITEDVALAEA